MSFEKALKYAIQQKKFEILRKLGVLLVHFGIGDESESETNNILEEAIHGSEALFFLVMFKCVMFVFNKR